MNDMDSRHLRHLLRTAATGSLILLSAAPLQAGRMFPDEPSRPHIHAGLRPNWGFNPTCWRRFPPVAPCESDGSCFADQEASGSFDHSGQIYTPQSEIIAPDGGFGSNEYSQEYFQHPSSGESGPAMQYNEPQNPMFPDHGHSSDGYQGFGHSGQGHSGYGNHGASGGLRYSQPVPGMPQGGSHPAVPQTAIPPIPEPSFSMPPGNGLQPAPLQEFHSLPQAPAALPPLPALPQSAPSTGIPPIPTQTSTSPQRLILGADGRLAVTTDRVTIARPVSESSRYGHRNVIGNPRQMAPPTVQGNPGVPVRFASESAAVPPEVHIVSPDSHTPLPRLYTGPMPSSASPMSTMGVSGGSSRYGAARPGQIQGHTPMQVPPAVQDSRNASPQFRPTPRPGSYR